MPSLVTRILLLALALGVLVDILVPGNAAGVNAPLVIAAVLGAALLLAGRDGLQRMDPADAWLGPVALALAAFAAIRADDWLVTIDLLLAAALAAGAVACLAGGRVTRGLVPQVLELAAGTLAAAVVGAGSVLARGRHERAGVPKDGIPARIRARLAGAAPVARGLLIAVPVVAVFVVLFASADAVFARYASDALAWQPDVDLAELVRRTILISVVAWGATGLFGLATGVLAPGFGPARAPTPQAAGHGAEAPPAALPVAPPETARPETALPGTVPPPPSPGTWGPAPAWVPVTPAEPRPPLRLGAVEAATILIVLDVLFAAFVALQLAYLFGGRDTLAVAGMTYADYARRGFFELVAVAVLAGALVVGLDLVKARRSRVLTGAALALLGMTAIVLVSALVRLRLYQDAYGWTELRFVVLTAILWLAVALAVTAALLARDRSRWVLHALGILVLVTVAGMNVVGPQAFVAERNLERALNPALVPPGGRTGLDADYLGELGDEAVVPIVRAWPGLGALDRDALTPVLLTREAVLENHSELSGWPAWNLTRERAREALRSWAATR